jgi:small subunit ribosomal protein S5
MADKKPIKKKIIKKKPEAKPAKPAKPIEKDRPGDKRSGYIRQRFPGRRVADRKREDAYEHNVIQLRRTTKFVEGGKRMRFSAMVAVGDKKGKVGIALAKAGDPRTAIEKGQKKAKKHLVKVPVVDGTVPHDMVHSYKAAKVFIRPAKEGTGLIAGSSVRTILELAGVKNAFAKIYGTNNKITNAYCVVEMLQLMKTPGDLAAQKGMAPKPEERSKKVVKKE